jgi:hypothetical protein
MTELTKPAYDLILARDAALRRAEQAEQAKEQAEADYAMLRAVARLCFRDNSSEQSMLNLWNLAASVDHPGAALIIRFNRAKAVVECWKRQPHYYDDCDPGQNDPYYAWYAEMGTLVTAFSASLKETETP